MSQHASRQNDQQKEQGGREQAEVDAGFSLNMVAQLSSLWNKYVKGLVPEKQPGQGAEAKKPEPKVATSPEPDAKTVHDGKDYVPTYQKMEGAEIIKDGVQHTDVRQGYIADCYLMAAMAAIAQQRPDLIQQMIQDHGDGTVTVTLYKANGGYAPPGEGKATPIRITTELPSKDGTKPAYAKGQDKELWPSLIEKAYVVGEKGGQYQGANTGGNAGHAMQVMLGAPSTSFSTSSKAPKEISGEIQKMLAAGKPVVAGSFGKDEVKTNQELKKLADEKSVYAWHAYSVVSVDPQTGNIKLYNPWGSDHPEELTGEEFQKLYRSVYIGNPPPPKKDAA